MRIAGINKLSLLDFPNTLSCIIFTAGCNLACPFCHNADLVTSCNTSQAVSTAEVFDFLIKRKTILEGVCITGGEPLLHMDIADFIKKVRALGYKIKLDTNGTFPDRLQELLDEGLIDYVAMDIKNSKRGYALAAGADIDYSKILKSTDIIMTSGVDYEFRTTLVNNIHTTDDIKKIGKQFALARRFYLQKFVDSGNIIKDGLNAPSDEDMQLMLAILREYIPSAELR